MNEDNLSDVEEFPITKEDWLSTIQGPFNFDTPAACAREVFSVNIYRNSFVKHKTCQVYGEIDIEDEKGTLHNLYNRELDDPEIVSLEDCTLSLDMPAECAIANNWVRMKMSLKDRTENAVIVEEVFGLEDVTKMDDYGRVRVQKVCGVGGSASVSYGVFPFAVLALVEIILIKKSDSVAATAAADVYGRIVARNGNTYGKRYPGIPLFKKTPKQPPTRVVSQIPFELSRAVVAVPAYSFLRLEVDLSDFHTNRPVVNGKAEFITQKHNVFRSDIQGEDFFARVSVEWLHPYALENEIEKQFKRPKIITDQPPCMALNICRDPILRKHDPFGFPLGEVFTVLIGHDSESVLSLCGTVRIDDSFTKNLVFNRDETNPETLYGNSNTISLAGPSQCYDGLGVLLNLRDVQGRVVIKGNITWDFKSISEPISWYDRRICSVIRGMHGYAAVHYTIFSRAVQALVNVSFKSSGSPDATHRVYGNIVAWYSNQDYSTEYERAYYRSVLFKEPQENSSELKSGCTLLPLLKSVVAVPVGASLIVEVDLYASSLSNGFNEERLQGVAEFTIDPDTSFSPVIQGKNYCIEYSVGWSKLFKLYSN